MPAVGIYRGCQPGGAPRLRSAFFAALASDPGRRRRHIMSRPSARIWENFTAGIGDFGFEQVRESRVRYVCCRFISLVCASILSDLG